MSEDQLRADMNPFQLIPEDGTLCIFQDDNENHCRTLPEGTPHAEALRIVDAMNLGYRLGHTDGRQALQAALRLALGLEG